jgi:hypothetical protein
VIYTKQHRDDGEQLVFCSRIIANKGQGMVSSDTSEGGGTTADGMAAGSDGSTVVGTAVGCTDGGNTSWSTAGGKAVGNTDGGGRTSWLTAGGYGGGGTASWSTARGKAVGFTDGVGWASWSTAGGNGSGGRTSWSTAGGMAVGYTDGGKTVGSTAGDKADGPDGSTIGGKAAGSTASSTMQWHAKRTDGNAQDTTSPLSVSGETAIIFASPSTGPE